MKSAAACVVLADAADVERCATSHEETPRGLTSQRVQPEGEFLLRLVPNYQG